MTHTCNTSPGEVDRWGYKVILGYVVSLRAARLHETLSQEEKKSGYGDGSHVKALAAKCDNISSILETHMVEAKN